MHFRACFSKSFLIDVGIIFEAKIAPKFSANPIEVKFESVIFKSTNMILEAEKAKGELRYGCWGEDGGMAKAFKLKLDGRPAGVI